MLFQWFELPKTHQKRGRNFVIICENGTKARQAPNKNITINKWIVWLIDGLLCNWNEFEEKILCVITLFLVVKFYGSAEGHIAERKNVTLAMYIL